MANEPKHSSDRVFRTAQEGIADRLRNRILTGELKPGDRLLQADIAREMRTSTTPVREALWQLTGAGLLDADPHRGVIVHTPTFEELTDIYDLRLILEPLALAAAVENITEEELQEAEAAIAVMDRDRDARTVTIQNLRFHEILAAASRRPRLAEILNRLNNVAMVYVVANLHSMPGRVQSAIDEHRGLIAACKAQDALGAQQLMVTHLRGTLVLSQESFGRSLQGSSRRRR